MKCFEVVVNGEPPVVVGDVGAGLIAGSLVISSRGVGSATFSAYIETSPSASEHRTWLSRRLSIGDELRIRVVESATPSTPEVTAQFGEAVESDAPLLACSMCRRKRDKVARLVSGGAVSICDECVALCVQSLSHATPASSKDEV
jgi:hypothetical protein